MSDESRDRHDPGVRVVYTGMRPPQKGYDGLTIAHLPMLEVTPVDFDVALIRRATAEPCTLVFYSQNSARIVAQSGAFDDCDLTRYEVWAVGEKTAGALATHLGVTANIPAEERFEGLVDELRCRPPASPVVAFTLKGSPRSLAGALADVEVIDIPVYRTRRRADAGLSERLRAFAPDWVAFTSPRGVAAFCDMIDASDLSKWRKACIGPTTASALRDRGMEPTLVLEQPDRERMMERILAFEDR